MIRTDSDFLKLAFRSYDNVSLTSLSEFESDLKKFNYLNTMLVRYKTDGEDFRLRVAINHLITIVNCFGPRSSIDLLRYKTSSENKEYVETILYFLNLIEKTEKLDFDLLNKLENL